MGSVSRVAFASTCIPLLLGMHAALTAATRQTPQTARGITVHVCVPPSLVVKESWKNPAPDSRMFAFQELLRAFILAEGDGRVQYRIREDAFARFNQGRNSPLDLVDKVNASEECPATNYRVTLELYPGAIPPSPAGARRDDEATRRGDPAGVYRLGVAYSYGAGGVQRDLGKACQLFQQAAQAGVAYAQAELGACYATGQGLPQNLPEAFRWFLRASEAGVTRAQEIVGDMYRRGDGVAPSAAKAAEWYRSAANKNSPYAMFQLGSQLRMGSGVRWNEAEAMRWFHRAAEMGETASMVGLGMGYFNGLGGGVQDYTLAAHWFAEALKYRAVTQSQEVDRGFALLNLAGLYEKGWGVNRDPNQAHVLYTQAAGSPVPFVAQEARKFLAAMQSPPPGGPTVSASQSSSDLLPKLVVGGIAILAVKALMSSSTGSEPAEAPSSNFDWGWVAEEEANRSFQRALVGCYWDEVGYLTRGYC